MLHDFQCYPPIINKLEESNQHTFYLTGSRFFKTNSPNSDWDFFVQESHNKENLVKYLLNLGFKCTIEQNNSYKDSLCDSVYWHPDNIHVQIVTDASIKQQAQAIIPILDPNLVILRLNIKPLCTELWNKAIEIVQALKKEKTYEN